MFAQACNTRRTKQTLIQKLKAHLKTKKKINFFFQNFVFFNISNNDDKTNTKTYAFKFTHIIRRQETRIYT